MGRDNREREREERWQGRQRGEAEIGKRRYEVPSNRLSKHKEKSSVRENNK